MAKRKTNPENLYQRKGTWWLRYNVGGRLVRSSLGTKSLREARRLKSEVMGNRDAARTVREKMGLECIPEAGPVPTVAEVVAKYLESCRSRGLRAPTLYRFECSANKWILPTFGHKHLGAITAEDVEAFVARLRRAPGRRGLPFSDTSVSNEFRALRRVFAFAKRRKLYLGPDPTDLESKPKPGPCRDVFLTEDEAGALLGSLVPQGRAAEKRDSWRLYYMVATAFYSGLRWGETNGLRWDEMDIDSDRPRIGVHRSYHLGPVKSAASDAEVEIHATLAALLRQWRQGNASEWVFPRSTGRPLKACSRRDNEKIHEAAERAGIRKYRTTKQGRVETPITCHVLRHSFGTLVFARTHDPKTLQALMRHSDVSVTMSKYVHAHGDQHATVNALPDVTAMARQPRLKLVS